MKLALLAFVIVKLLAACVPNTPDGMPPANLPASYRGATNAAGRSFGPSLGTLPWQKIYGDPVLQDLIASALAHNDDVALAYQNIRIAEATLGITHSAELPQGTATAQVPYQRTEGSRPPSSTSSVFAPEVAASASYEIDLFGKLASATVAARAQLLATVEARNVLLGSIVAQVATTYFQLRELDAILDVTRKTSAVRTEDVRLMKLRVQYGESSQQDLDQSEQSLLEADEQIPLLQQGIAQAENALSVLCGTYPHDIARGRPLEDQVALPDLPPTGLPAELVQQRPDIRQADATLVAADANLDVAHKLLYPALSFGASVGLEGTTVTGVSPAAPKLNGLFYGPQGLLAAVPSLAQTIFSGGRIRAQIAQADAQRQATVISYLKTVLVAYTDVSNAAITYNQSRSYRAQVETDDAVSADSTRLANLRYQEGQTSYLEVLNAQTRSYQADVTLQQARLTERVALIQLYLALGGGWQS